jgi:EF hand
MVSGIGGGMPSMDAVRQMQQKMFAKADGNGSGGLDSTEFESMMKNGPMASADAKQAFAKIDADGSGELSATEMEDAHKQMMERFQSTMQSFGGAKGTQQQGGDASWQTLLDAVGGASDDSERSAVTTDRLVAQLRGLIEKLGATYGSSSAGGNLALSA